MKLRDNSLSVVVILGLLWPSIVAVDLTVQLRERCELQAERALLADIAELSGDPVLIELASDAVVQALYDSATYHISAGDVRIALADLIPRHRVAVSGACAVVRASERFDEAAIAAVATSHVQAWIGPEVVSTIRTKRVSGPLSVPALAAQPARLVAEALVNDPWGEVPYRVKLMRGEQELARALVVLEASATRRQPVAARDLQRGHIIGLHDLRIEEQQVQSGAAVSAPTMQDLVGRVVSNRFRAGDPVTMSRTREPALVHGGAQVTLVYQHDRFEVTIMGTALADGRMSEEIRIRQPNGHAVRARVTGPGQAVVNY